MAEATEAGKAREQKAADGASGADPARKMIRWPVFPRGKGLLRLTYTRSGGSYIVLGSRDADLLRKAEALGFEAPKRNGDVVRSIPVGRIRLADIVRGLGAGIAEMTQADFMASPYFQNQAETVRPASPAAAPKPRPREAPAGRDGRPAETPSARERREAARERASEVMRAAEQEAERAEQDLERRLSTIVENAKVVGVNVIGQEVYEDQGGRYRVSRTGGRQRIIPEIMPGRGMRDGAPSLFLRGVDAAAFRQAADAVVAQSGQRTVRATEIRQLAEALVSPGPHGERLLFEGDGALDAAMAHLRSEIVDSVLNVSRRNASTPQLAFMTAVRHTEALVGVSGLADGHLDLSPPLAIAIARALDLASVEPRSISIDTPLADRSVLAFVAPREASLVEHSANGRGDENHGASQDAGEDAGRTDRGAAEERGAPFIQILDYRGRGLVAADMAMSALARRADDGRMLLIVDGGPDGELTEKIRGDLAGIYTIESSMHLTGQLAAADPVRAEDGIMVFSIGPRRPEATADLPEAARRVISASRPHDLWNWANETRRSRGRIAEWIEGLQAGAHDDAAPDEGPADGNRRQAPYQPLSQLGEAVTMVPRTLHGATNHALARLARRYEADGGVDGWLAARLDMSPGQIEERFSPEQIDAVAMAHLAFERGRGFLEADQTGVGKGRALAGIAAVWLRGGENRKVVYFTERGDVNVPDVYRDIVDTGVDGLMSLAVVATGTEVRNAEGDIVLRSMKAKDRKALQETMAWPQDANTVITTYSMYNRRGSIAAEWLAAVTDENTLVILDECQNALNKSGATGHNIREMLRHAGARCFASATPLREPSGADLYASLLPVTMRERDMGAELAAGGSSVQEVFTTMLASDGVMIRRDHDIANVIFEVSLPEPDLTERYHDAMERLAPVVSAMLTASGEASNIMSEHMTRARAAMRRANVGMEAGRINARMKQLHSYAVGFGSPLVNLTNVYLNALKVEQTAQEVIAEIRQGRKPMISLHSTNGAFFDELARDADGRPLDADALRQVGRLTVKDQLKRIHDRLYLVRMNGEPCDLREENPRMRRVSDEIVAMIDALPDLTASPIDELTERLEAEGLVVGELTGRKLQYRGGELSRRPSTPRRRIIDGFNNGEIDVLIYNSAGATGGSYHASPHFADQRPRSMVEMETPPDIIRYVQGQGRGNRYGQVARPKVKSIVSGLTTEMRLMAFRNRKLRALGASVEGNREHPMLLREAPDIINAVGDAAAARLLMLRPDISRRLDLGINGGEANGEQAENENEVDQQIRGIDGDDMGAASTQNLANRLIARLILLPVREQEELFAHLESEFDTLVEELDQQNRNPLRPRRLDGHIEIRATTLFSGIEDGEMDDRSAFLDPVRISTGRHVFTGSAVTGEQMLDLVNRGLAESGPDGFIPWARSVEERIPVYLLSYVADGQSVEMAMAEGRPAVMRNHARLADLVNALGQLRPGTVLSIDDTFGERLTMVVTRTVAPSMSRLQMYSTSYAVYGVCPGDSKPGRLSVSHLLRARNLEFHGNVLDEDPTAICQEFDRMLDDVRQMPVQVLTGNILEANQVARNNKLGAIVLFDDQDGVTHRGIAVNPNRVNLDHLPMPVMARCILDGIRSERYESGLFAWMRDGENEPVRLNYFQRQRDPTPRVFFKAPSFNRRWEEFWRSGPVMAEIYRLVTGNPLPDEPVPGGSAGITMIRRKGDPDLDRLVALLDRCEAIELHCSGRIRDWVNEWHGTIHQQGPGSLEAGIYGPDDDATVEAGRQEDAAGSRREIEEIRRQREEIARHAAEREEANRRRAAEIAQAREREEEGAEPVEAGNGELPAASASDDAVHTPDTGNGQADPREEAADADARGMDLDGNGAGGADPDEDEPDQALAWRQGRPDPTVFDNF